MRCLFSLGSPLVPKSSAPVVAHRVRLCVGDVGGLQQIKMTFDLQNFKKKVGKPVPGRLGRPPGRAPGPLGKRPVIETGVDKGEEALAAISNSKSLRVKRLFITIVQNLNSDVTVTFISLRLSEITR